MFVRSVLCSAVIASLVCFGIGNVFAQVAVPENDELAAEITAREVQELLFGDELEDTFAYRREGRSDPFMPFITDQILKSDVEEENEVLTGMRQFEPSQLRLVAIVFAGNSPLAMVEDPVGKGYIIKKGTKIGRYGKVEQIVPNMVVIKQATYTSDQEKLYKTVEMVLKKEGEK